jgi:hypothetical protein
MSARARVIAAAAAVVLMVVASPALGTHKHPKTAGGIKLGTWTADLGRGTGTGVESTITMRLTRTGSGSFTAAHLKLFRFTGDCRFVEPGVGTPLAPIAVTWTYNHPNSLGPIGFVRSRQSGQALDLDENQPGPMTIKIHFASQTSATGTVAASDTPTSGGATCFTGSGMLATQVQFTAHWAHS